MSTTLEFTPQGVELVTRTPLPGIGSLDVEHSCDDVAKARLRAIPFIAPEVVVASAGKLAKAMSIVVVIEELEVMP